MYSAEAWSIHPTTSGCRVLSRFDPNRRSYRKIALQDGKLMGLAMVGAIEQGGVLLSLIQRQLPLAVDPEQLLEASFSVAALKP